MKMHARPYMTTGVAIVGASVIAVTPIAPPPTETVRGPVELAVSTVASVNPFESLIQDLVAASAAFGHAGVAASQGLVDLPGTLAVLADIVSNDPELLPNALSTVAFTAFGIASSVLSLSISGVAGPLPPPLGPEPPDSGLLLDGFLALSTFIVEALNTLPEPLDLPPTLNATAAASEISAAATEEGLIEGAVNTVLFAATAATLRLAVLPAPLVAQILGIPVEQAQGLLGIGTLGLFGPLISGPGSMATATQDILDELGEGDFASLINELIGAPGTVIDGFVNGGYGPNLSSLIAPFFPAGVPDVVLAGGLINEVVPGDPAILEGTIPALQILVGELLGLLSPADMANVNGSTSANENPVAEALGRISSAIQDVRVRVQEAVTPTALEGSGAELRSTPESLNVTASGGQVQVDRPAVTPKKHRQLVNLNVFKVNPLDRGDKDEQTDANAAENDGGPRHRLGLGKTPVRDLVKRVLGGGDRDDDTDTESEAAAG
jgi:hypothetical protein